MAKISSRLKKAFNQYYTKDAVLDYVDSLSNPHDLLSGDLKILKDIKDERLRKDYELMQATLELVENAHYIPNKNAVGKRDDFDSAQKVIRFLYTDLKKTVQDWMPEVVDNLDDSKLDLRLSKYNLSEKDAILAYYQSLKNPKDLLSGSIGEEHHWIDNKAIYDSYKKYTKQCDHYEYCGKYKSMEQRAEESKELVARKIEFYDQIHGQLKKFFPEYAALYDEHINPSIFDITKESLGMKAYVESLRDKTNITTGNPNYLPEFIKPYWERIEDLSKEGACLDYDSKSAHSVYEKTLNDAIDHYKAINSNVVQEPQETYSKSNKACETYLNDKEIIHQQNSDMKEKKTKKSEPKEEKAAKASKQSEPKEEKVAKQAEPKEEKKAAKAETKEEKREPQMVTVNGDKITHAHAFKSNKSEDWFYSVRINGEPLKAKVMDAKDVERVFNDPKGTVQEMMQKYHPTVLMPKVSPAEFKLPKPITTANGEEQIVKFVAYKDNDPNSMSFGKYRLYAQVGDKKMSTEASKQDLDAYFNRVATPTQLITKNFGDKLGIAAHYEQFKLPEGMNLEGKNILLKKNQETNRYEISVKTPEGVQTRAKELSYDDRQSYFSHKVASKEQLAAKYLSNELSALSMAPKPKVEKQMSLGI